MSELTSELPALYHQLAAQTSQEDATTQDQHDQYDESAWQAFLAEHGVRWDGAGASWEQFKRWFLYEAERRTLTVPANGFVTYVEGQADKASVFALYGISITTASADPAGEPQANSDVSAFPEVKEGDSGEWVQYLDAMLTSQGF